MIAAVMSNDSDGHRRLSSAIMKSIRKGGSHRLEGRLATLVDTWRIVNRIDETLHEVEVSDIAPRGPAALARRSFDFLSTPSCC